jgi:hypothetical protein
MTLTNKLTEGGNKMRLNTKIFIIFLNILFILSPSISAPSDKCAEQNSEQINTYIKYNCPSPDNIKHDNIKAGFAPFKEKKIKFKGEFAYELVEDSYPDKTFPIGDKNFNDRIWFYSNIKKDSNNKMPRYIWHLIVSPASKIPQRDNAEGFLVNFDSKDPNRIDKLDLIKRRRDEILLTKSVVDGKEPKIYTNNEISEKDIHEGSELNDVWKGLLIKSETCWDLIECERWRRNMKIIGREGAYDYTFYLNEIRSEPENVNIKYGYRIVSSKKITSPGEIYGFVLNEDGSCLGYQMIPAK